MNAKKIVKMIVIMNVIGIINVTLIVIKDVLVVSLILATLAFLHVNLVDGLAWKEAAVQVPVVLDVVTHVRREAVKLVMILKLIGKITAIAKLRYCILISIKNKLETIQLPI